MTIALSRRSSVQSAEWSTDDQGLAAVVKYGDVCGSWPLQHRDVDGNIAQDHIFIYQGAPGLIPVKMGLFCLRSRFDWVTFAKYLHGFARLGFGQASS